MLYPKFLKEKDTIGITAPSQGVGDNIESFEKSLTTLTKNGYQIKETASVRNKGITSTTGEKRSKELDELITDTNYSKLFAVRTEALTISTACLISSAVSALSG